MNKSIEKKSLCVWIWSFVSLFSFFIWFILTITSGLNSVSSMVLFRSSENLFADFLNSVAFTAPSNPYISAPSELQDRIVPPLGFLVFKMFRSISTADENYSIMDYEEFFRNNSLLLFMGLLFVGILVYLTFEILKKNITNENTGKFIVSLTLLLSMPVVFAIERGNIIILALLFSIIFIFYHRSDNKIIRELALISLAISAGIKLTPAALGLLLVLNKQWKESIRTVIYGVIAFFLPFLAFEGGFSNIPLYFKNTGIHFQVYITSPCTLFGCLYSISNQSISINSHRIISIVGYILALIMILSLPLIKSFWQRLLILTVIMIMIPGVAQFYCLIYFIPAIVVFINDSEAINNYKIILLAFLLITVFDPVHQVYAIGELLLLGCCLYISFMSWMNFIKSKKSN